MLLRCTARLLDLLGRRDLVLVDDPPGDDDWYANLLWLDRRKCLLLTHAGTLFPIFIADVRKRDLQPPGPLLAARIEAALAAERLPAELLGTLDSHAGRTSRDSLDGARRAERILHQLALVRDRRVVGVDERGLVVAVAHPFLKRAHRDAGGEKAMRERADRQRAYGTASSPTSSGRAN